MIMIIIKPTILRTRPSFIAGGGVGVGGLKDFGCFRTKTSLIPL